MLKVVGASWMKIRMSTWIIGIVLALGIIVVIIGQMGQLEEDGNYAATTYWNPETGFEIKFWGQGLDIETVPKGVARVYYQSHIDTNGWAIMDLETQSDYPDWVQAYAAGMLEGSLTWQLIHWHWKNTVQNVCRNQKLFCSYVRTYLEENMKSVKKQYENTDDPYWHQVYLFYVQLEGIQQGFEHGVKRSRQTIEELHFVDFLWMNAASDIVDLEYKFYDSKPYTSSVPDNQTNSKDLSDSVLLTRIRNLRSVEGYTSENRHVDEERRRSLIGCGVTMGSALVKVIPDEEKLLVAHNSAGPYVSMLRMIKSYHFRYHWSASNFWTIENKLMFSSYPAAIHSMDDFYVISQDGQKVKLIVTGTPITLFNKDLWKHVSPQGQVLSGVRLAVAGRLSGRGSTYTEYLSRHNSGTGNKQWLVVDVGKFKEWTRENGSKATNEGKDVLWVAEQLPGVFVAADQTKVLSSEGYWASYGLPFYKNVSELSGVVQLQDFFGDAFSYENSPLAKIYRRDQATARNLKATMNLMRSNSYKKDPLSLGNPRCAIGARGDVPTEVLKSFPIGVIDSKVFSFDGKFVQNTSHVTRNDTSVSDDDEDVRTVLEKGKTTFRVVAGPAHGPRAHHGAHVGPDADPRVEEDFLKPFNWADSVFTGFPHNGHPNNWDFDQILVPT